MQAYQSRTQFHARNGGYSITELIVVIAGISALAAFATPNVVRYVKEGQVDEAKALLNTAAAECGSQISAGADPQEISPNALRGKSLPGLYSYEGEKTKAGDPNCVFLLLEDKANNASRLTTLGIEISPNPLTYKKIAEFKHPDGELGCKDWAASNCTEGGEIERLKAEAAARAAEAQRVRDIEQRYLAWLQGPPAGSGHYTNDGKDIWAFQGREVADQAAFLAAQEDYFGAIAIKNFRKWLDGPPKGDGHYTADGLDKWAVNGEEVKTKDEYDLAKVNSEKDKVEVEAAAAAKAGMSMKITIGSYSRWVHGGEVFDTESAWNDAKANDSQGGGQDNLGEGDGEGSTGEGGGDTGGQVRPPEYTPPSNCTIITLPIPGTSPLQFEERMFCA